MIVDIFLADCYVGGLSVVDLEEAQVLAQRRWGILGDLTIVEVRYGGRLPPSPGPESGPSPSPSMRHQLV